jgi:hypothetical protein
MADEEKSHPIYTPSINLCNPSIEKDDTIFYNTCKELGPVYEIALNNKTEKEIKEELKKSRAHYSRVCR